jgi:quinol monooxygenase YgiN
MADLPLVAIAVMEPFDGKEEEFLQVLQGLYLLLERKNYSRDLLFRDGRNPERFFNVRRWNSSEARADAQEDPDVHHYWAQLGLLCNMRAVHALEEIDWKTL